MARSAYAGLACFVVALGGCAANAEGIDPTDSAAGELARVPAFLGSAPSSPAKLFGRDAQRFAASEELARIVSSMEDGEQNATFAAGGFRLPPNLLDDFRSSFNAF